MWNELKESHKDRATFQRDQARHRPQRFRYSAMAPDLTIATWIWGNKYPGHYLARLKQGIKDHLAQNFRWLVFTPMEGDEHLLPGCFVRLRMFSPAWQRAHQIREGTRLVCLDLDVVITGRLDPLFDRDDDFLILKGCNAANPCPFNGSIMMLRAGAHPEIWQEFSLEAAQAIPYYQFPGRPGLDLSQAAARQRLDGRAVERNLCVQETGMAAGRAVAVRCASCRIPRPSRSIAICASAMDPEVLAMITSI